MILEDAARASDADFQLIAELIPHIVWMSAPDGSTVYLNQHGWTYAGLSPATGYERNWVAQGHPDDVERTVSAWEHATRTQTPYSVDARIRRFDGEYRWHAFRCLPIRDESGSVLKWIGTATDIEDPKRLEADLRLAEHQTAEALSLLETLQSKAPIGFAVVDRDFRLVRINEALAAIDGATVAELLGKRVADILPQIWPQLESLYRRVLDTGEAILNVEVDDPAAASAVQTRLTSYYPVKLDDEIIGIGIVVIDITERKAAEEARRQLSAIVDGSGDAIFGTTVDGVITSWNRAATELFGYSAEEIIGQPVATLAPAGLAVQQVGIRRRLNSGGPQERFETTRRRKDGSLVEVLVSVSATLDAAGKVDGLSVIAHDISERLTAHRALEASRSRLAEAQRTARLGSFEFDVATGVLTWSEEYYRILGLDPSLAASSDLFMSMVHPDDVRAAAQLWAAAVNRGLPFDHEFRVIRTDSEERSVRARSVPEMAADGAVVKVVGTMMDDTERVEADRIRRTAETRFEIGFEQSAIGAVIADLRGIPIRVNTAVCAILGRSADVLVGRRWTEYSHPDEVMLWKAAQARVAAGHDTYADERRFVRPDGSVVWVSSHITLVRDEAGKPQYFFLQLQDITERKQMEDELAHRALHDSLTGLPNRALLTDRLYHGLAGSRRRRTQLGVMFLDIDHFKMVNDSFGHSAGDDLLRQAAARIASAIRPGDTVARVGGDEFVVVCDDISALATEQIAERVLESLSQPWRVGSQEIRVKASLGIAIADEHATPESLVRDSDAAMYRAKQRGRGRVELFDETLRSNAERRLATASALHRAMEREEFTLHYQPVVDLSTGEMVSAEALLRWNQPGRGLVSPTEFIPLAEETGLIVPIGAWVVEEACRQLAEWQAIERSLSGAAKLSVAVNLSVRQILAPDIACLIDSVLRRTGVRPADLCLELTESVFMQDVDYFGPTLAGLKALGVGLAIDDFGMGYSSLSYLKRFPVNAVKVDRAFVDGLGTDPHDTALVAAIVAMAGAFGLEVTGEGVETKEQLTGLRRLDVTRAQGFYLARPMPADELTRLVAESYRWYVN